MKLTDEQKTAVDCPDNVLLNACPGSGKTRVVISKLVRAIEEVRGTPRAAACITYTNTAVQEIEIRLRRHLQVGDDPSFDVCTIHSFCLNHIFRFYCHRLPGFKKGFKVLTPEAPAFTDFVKRACAETRQYELRFADFEEFANVHITLDGKATGISVTSGALKQEEAKRYWTLIQKDGYVDFCNILYHSLQLLKAYPEIVDYLASRFAWILVDEFQDTSDLQVEVLSLIAKCGRTKFFLVGDPNQSIFGFAGAHPELATPFARTLGARTDLILTGNFRSSKPIVAHAELLIPRQPPMSAVGETASITRSPQYVHVSTPLEALTTTFFPALKQLEIPIGEAAVLAPTWFSLFPLGRKLRQLGVPVVGPGARPYRRNRLFAGLAEHICGYLVDPDPEAITGIERALFNTLLDATGRPNFEVLSYHGRTVVFQLLAEAEQLRNGHQGAVAWLEAAAASFSKLLLAAGYLCTAEFPLLSESVEEMKRDMLNNKIALETLGLDDIGVYASPKAALKLASLHFAKGREYEAVAMIDLHEGKIPFYKYKTAEEFASARRLFYVGITRARRYLLYVTDSLDRRNVPTRFLRGQTGVGVC